jgi:hypothetical protein
MGYSYLGGMEGLAMLHRMEQMLVYNCPTYHYGPGRYGFVTTEMFSPRT